MASPSATAAAGLYRDVLGRAPDDVGLAQLTASLDAGVITLDAARIGLAASPEAQGMIGGFYAALLGRAADAGGLAQFTGALASGKVDLAGVRAAIAGSPEAARAAVPRVGCRAQVGPTAARGFVMTPAPGQRFASLPVDAA